MIKIPLPSDLTQFIDKKYNPYDLFYSWVIKETLTDAEKVLYSDSNLDYFEVYRNKHNRQLKVTQVKVSDKFDKEFENLYIAHRKLNKISKKRAKEEYRWRHFNYGPSTIQPKDNLDENYIYILEDNNG